MLPAEAPADAPAAGRCSRSRRGAAVGFGLGGWLLAANLSGLGWRTVFFAKGAGIALVHWRAGDFAASPRKNLLSAALLLAALMCLIGPLLIGADLGWPAWLAPSAPLRIALLALFWWSQG
jgi:hypothetical protein